MAEVLDVPPEPLPRDDRRRDRSADRKDRAPDDRRRDREPRERRDERVATEREDRPPRREHNHERRNSNEERPAGSSGNDRRERDRDYKRRKSPTPPPYPQRDRERRHTPPARRSPPYKRRRDDEFEGGRRSTPPRGGVISSADELGRQSGFSGDRRYGYDGMGPPYERAGGMGGRGSGFGGDERSQGRHGGRSAPSGFHGPLDWPGPGRTGFSDGPYPSNVYGGGGPPRREGLMTYKQFIGELEDDILPGEAERRYEEYKTEFITTQKRSFFEQHKDDDWLREKYDPSRLEAVLVRRNENAKILAKEFITELQGGTLDVGPSARSSMKDDSMSEDDGDTGGKRRRQGRGPTKAQEINAAPKAPSGSSEPKRVTKDIEVAQALIKKLDAEKGIEGNILSPADNQNAEGERSLSSGSLGPIVIVRGANQVKGLEGLELMDVMLTYLWRIHSMDYYGMIELKEPPRRLRHIRGPELKNGGEEVGLGDWEKKLDSTWQARLQGRDLIEAMLGREKLETTANEALDPFVRKIRDEKYGWKYGCGAKGCTKLFHGPEYVHKHLKLKHSDLVSDVVAKAREELYFQNYMSDADAPGATQASIAQPGQRGDRGRRRRPGLPVAPPGPGDRMPGDRMPPNVGLPPQRDGRLGPRDGERFDRGGGVREEEARFDREGREEELRFDRGAPELSPPPHDFPPMVSGAPPYEGGVLPHGGPFDGGPSEPPMFDHFNGPPMRGRPGGPFGQDMPPPPPVLMPVPGAGPLGPFVPAPPEVARQYFRDGPPQFHPGAFDGVFEGEGNGGPLGRKVRPGGPMMAGGLMDAPPMLMPPFHAVRHDPRNVRSYHDLDAPEDEVTVIDYRSL